jgi:hypothetical protein
MQWVVDYIRDNFSSDKVTGKKERKKWFKN